MNADGFRSLNGGNSTERLGQSRPLIEAFLIGCSFRFSWHLGALEVTSLEEPHQHARGERVEHHREDAPQGASRRRRADMATLGGRVFADEEVDDTGAVSRGKLR